MSSQILFSGGDKWFSYSGELFGDVSVPATIQTNLIPNTGLKDSLVKIMPFYGDPAATTTGEQLGVKVKLNDVTIINSQNEYYADAIEGFTIFIPRQSKLEVISLNVSANNTQIRGVNLIGYYL